MMNLMCRRAFALSFPLLIAPLWSVAGCAGPQDARSESARSALVTQQAPDAGDFHSASAPIPGRFTDPASMYRQVIRQASLEERVESVVQAERDVNRIVEQAGGFTEKTSAKDLATNPMMNMVVRVPAPEFGDVIAKFEALGVRMAKSVETQDVTAQLAQLNAQLERFRTRNAELEAGKKTRPKQKQILDTQRAIQGTEATLDPLASSAALSTISLTLEQDAVVGSTGSDPRWFAESFAEATSAGGLALKSIVILAIWVAVFSPIWALIAYLALRLFRRRSQPYA